MLALVLVFTAAVRFRMLDAPLERDEGEYAYAGQLMLEGVPPYLAAYNMKFPGVYAAYAVVLALFGQSTRAIHWGLLAANAIAIGLVYVLTKRFFGSFAGVVAAASYAIFSMSRSFLGMAAHATHFVVIPALAGILLLLNAGERQRLWLLFSSGLCLGLAFLMKQHGAVFPLFGFAYLLSTTLRRRPAKDTLTGIAVFSAGVLVPLAVTCVALFSAGVFERFRFWTVDYARAYASEMPLRDAWHNLQSDFLPLLRPFRFLLLLAGLGLVSIWRKGEQRARAIFLSTFLLVSLLSVVPGFWFREHYFILLLPPIAILVGAAASSAVRLFAEWKLPAALCYGLSALLVGVAFGQSLLAQKDLLFHMSPYEASRVAYGHNPFPEAVVIGRYISTHSRPDARVAVIGSEPEIYFYSHRRSATGYIYTYALMEHQPYARRMQEEMIREIETARPEYLVLVSVWMSWLAREGSEKLILDWFPRYASEHYERVGVVDILPSGTIYRWEGDAAGYSAQSQFIVYVYRVRKQS